MSNNESEVKRPSKPNYYRFPEGRAAVDTTACPRCRARKGAKCVSTAGTATSYVHPERFAKWAKAAEKAAEKAAAE